MRWIHSSLLALTLFALVGCSAEESTETGVAPAATTSEEAADAAAGDGIVYGEPTGEGDVVDLPALVAKPADYVGKRVRVEGLVTEVCAKRGCWVDIGMEEGPDKFRFKVVDGVIVFPMEAKGGHIEAEGTVSRHELDLETTRDLFKRRAEAKGEEFDESKVLEPYVYYQLDGIGAVVRTAE